MERKFMKFYPARINKQGQVNLNRILVCFKVCSTHKSHHTFSSTEFIFDPFLHFSF